MTRKRVEFRMLSEVEEPLQVYTSRRLLGGRVADEPAAILAIGNTPLFRLRKFARRAGLTDDIELWLKAEWANPGGSVKDRPALAIVRNALANGSLSDDRVLLDSTSGNTGIAYAMLGAVFGFQVELVIPENASEERKAMLRAYGATVVTSDPYEGSNGAIEHARRLYDKRPDHYFYADQYSNPCNPAAHFATTGPEIWDQTGERVTHFVAGLGTSGTLMGVGGYLRRRKPDVAIVAVQPAESFHGIEGLKHLRTAIVPAIYDEAVPSAHVGVDTEDAYSFARELATTEGLFAGTSTGAALAGAVSIGRELMEVGETAVIVALAPDGGGKYLSTELWS